MKKIAIILLTLLMFFNMIGSYPVDIVGQEIDVVTDPLPHAVRGTVLRSINNTLPNELYQPSYEEVSFLKDLIINGDYGISTVYTGAFDKDRTAEDYTDDKGSTRAYRTLGKDILLKSENYTSNGQYTYDVCQESSVLNQSVALMAIYKALKQNEYSVPYFHMYANPGDVSLGTSPFEEEVGSDNAIVEGQYYNTDVYITRTVPEKYWRKGLEQGVVSTPYTSGEKDKTLSTGEFCYWLATILEINGEQVLNDKETQALLVTYGAELPTGLPSYQLEAVRYLVARGIATTDLDFYADIKGSVALELLTRAADKDSRLTFKQMELEYNKDLVGEGYYPTKVTNNSLDIRDATWDTTNVATSKYYDYMVRKTPFTTFHTVDGRETQTLFVSADPKGYDSENVSNTNYKCEDTEYLGEENGYYHFRIPADIETKSAACIYNGVTCICITTTDNKNTPSQLYLEVGGGWYNELNDKMLKRSPFQVTDNSLLIDRNRKVASIKEVSNPIYLTEAQEYKYSFTTDKPENIIWKGKALKDSIGKDGITQDGNTYTITLKKSNPTSYINKNLSTKSGETHSYPAYVKENSLLYVSSNFFMDLPDSDPYKITEIIQSEDDKDQYTVVTPYENIIINNKSRRVISGQCISEIPKEATKSDLILKSESDTYLIDYRCIAGVITGYLVLSDTENKVVSIATTAKSDENSFTPVEVRTATGNDYATYCRAHKSSTDGTYAVLLETSYAKSNFLIYKLNSYGSSLNYLLVFKPHTALDNEKDRSETAKILLNKFGITLGPDDTCTMYLLSETVVSQDPIYKKISADRIKKVSGVGYSYIVPSLEEFNFDNYLNPATTSNNPLPFVTVGNYKMLYDMNLNIVDSMSYNRYPNALLNPQFIRDSGINGDLLFNSNSAGYSKDAEATQLKGSYNLQYAPLGLYTMYYKQSIIKAKNLKNKSDQNVLIGNMRGELKDGGILAPDSITYTSRSYATDVSDGEFIKAEIKLSKGQETYIYKNPHSSYLTNATKDNGLGFGFSVGKGLKNLFDWDNFSFVSFVTNLCDTLSLLYIIVIFIGCRIVTFDFMIVAVLSLVRDVRFVQKAAAQYVDIYKVLSLGVLDIRTIDPVKIWVSTFLATILTAILYRGYYTDLLAMLNSLIIRLLNG